MARASIGLAALAIAGCGGSSTVTVTQTVTQTGASADTGAPARVAGVPHQIVAAGCLACHRIGTNGNDGPGAPLERIGADLSATQIRQALLSPEAPMPSYQGLPRAKLDAIVRFLSRLR